MTPDLKRAEYVGDYKIHLWFENGKDGAVDFAKYINRGGVFSSLKDITLFKAFYIDSEVCVLVWPNKIDIAPEELYSVATGEPLPQWMSQDAEYKKAG